jgi:hypothetical protein
MIRMFGADFKAENGGQRARHQAGIAERGQIDQPDAVLIGALAHSKRHGLTNWERYGRGYRGVAFIKRGDVAGGLRLLSAASEATGETGISASRFIRFAACYMAEALGHAGQIADGISVIEDAIARAERTAELWQIAELLRVKGELLLLPGAFSDAAAAENYFRQALDRANPQGALSWELRAATSLARLRRGEGRCAEAIALLHPVHDRFTEGFGTADLKSAKALLDILR